MRVKHFFMLSNKRIKTQRVGTSKMHLSHPHTVIIYVFFLSCVSYAFCALLFICALWSPAGKRLTSWLSFVVSNCEFDTSPLVLWVRCGT